MKTATVRQVQHHFAEVLRWVNQGQEVQIKKRNRVVAKIVPFTTLSQKVGWPDFEARAKAIFGSKPKGKLVSEILMEDREERL